MKRTCNLVLAALMLAALFAGCAANQTPAATTTAADATSAATSHGKYQRIVCGSVAAVEILVGLGLSENLVCIDNYAFDVEGIPADVAMMDFYTPNPEAVLGYEPDLLIVQKFDSNDEGYKPVKDTGVDFLMVAPSVDTVEEVAQVIRDLAEAVGVPEKGEELAANMMAEVDRLTAIGAGVKEKKTVYFEVSPAPEAYAAGSDTFIDDMLRRVGAVNILEGESGYVMPSAEHIVAKNPDVILTNATYTEDPVGEIMARGGYDAIKAVENKQVFTIDANSTSRPSQHVVKAILEIGRAVYPELYD